MCGLFALLSSCASSGSAGTSTDQIAVTPESVSNEAPENAGFQDEVLQLLQDQLETELGRLQSSGQRSPATAPSGEANAIFDLSVAFMGHDGGAVLQWTERAIGDYDMNGIVNAADLTPLAQRWLREVDYRDAQQTGIGWWPAGNPRNGGILGVANGKPGVGTPADHWRNARIDGDGNGVLNLADVTPIAAHWQESLDSYRVYRRAPGESEFSLIETTGKGYSLLRSESFPPGSHAPDGNWAFRLYFADLNTDLGTYEYMVAPFDRSSESEGHPSNTVAITFTEQIEPPPPPQSGNDVPVAEFSFDVQSGDAPLTVHFDASASHDHDGQIVLHLWDWNGDGVIDYSSGASAKATYVFSEPGYYEPVLHVRDDMNATASAVASDIIAVSDSGLMAPRLTISASPASGRRPLPLNLTVEIDAPSGTDGMSWAWDFNADGVIDSSEPYQQDGIPVTFDLPGLYTVRLQVTDQNGLKASADCKVDVLDNNDPEAEVEVDKASGMEGDQFTFNAAGSEDADGDQLSYSWDLDGDGEFETDTGHVPELQHTFADAGIHNVYLIASDPYGGADVDGVSISISSFTNEAPVAQAAADRLRYGVPAPITFNSYGSHDPDGPDIDTFHWDFDNDGQIDVSTGSHSITHVYDTPGFYLARLFIEDIHGASDEVVLEVEAVDNTDPIAVFTASPESGNLPLDVLFDASASSDPDGDPLTYHWEFNFEGSQDFGSSGSITEQHTYLSAGQHTCALLVRDGLGGSSLATQQVSASGSGWQVVQLDEGRSSSWIPELNLQVVDGVPAVAYVVREGAGTREGSIRYIQAQDADGLNWGEPAVLESTNLTGHRGHGVSMRQHGNRPALSWLRENGELRYVTGEMFSTLEWKQAVTVASGLNGVSATELLSAGSRPAIALVDSSSRLKYSIALDAAGLSWTEPATLLQLDPRSDWHKPEMAMVSGHPAMSYINELNFDCSVFYMRAGDALGGNWEQPQQIGGIDANFSGSSLAVINGIPQVAFYGENGLMFRSANDASGSSWAEPVDLAPYGYFDSAWIYEQLSLKDFGGVPAILDIHMQLWIAEDAAGSSWLEPVKVPDGYSGSCFEHALVNGNPAIAFQQDHLFYAVWID